MTKPVALPEIGGPEANVIEALEKLLARARAGEIIAEQRKCRDKRQHNTRKLAKKAIHKGRGLHVYKCSYCNFWHLTHRANGERWNGKIAPKSHSPQNQDE